jgi:hypothetical protein
MAGLKAKTWGLITLVVILVLVVGGIVGFQAAVGLLKDKVVEALGPDSDIKAMKVGWSGVGVDGLSSKGRKGWPAADTLRAEQVWIVPSLLEAPGPKGKATTGPPARAVTISRVNLEDGVIEFFDGAVAQPPLRIRLEKIQATVRHVTVPSLSGKSQFDLREILTVRMAASLAETLGVSIRGVAEGVGTLGQKGVQGTGEAVKGIGGALERLLGGGKKR